MRSICSSMFRLDIERGLVEVNPVAGITSSGSEPRERLLADAQLDSVWHGLEASVLTRPARLAAKLLLLTAQRRGEQTGARWAEIDLEAGLWHIPAEVKAELDRIALTNGGITVGEYLARQGSPKTGWQAVDYVARDAELLSGRMFTPTAAACLPRKPQCSVAGSGREKFGQGFARRAAWHTAAFDLRRGAVQPGAPSGSAVERREWPSAVACARTARGGDGDHHATRDPRLPGEPHRGD